MAHTVQFFDALETIGATVARLIHDSAARGLTTLVVARPRTVAAIAQALSSHDMRLQDLVSSGRVIVRDASDVLRSIIGLGTPRFAQFDTVIGPFIRELARPPGGLAIYGEMVDILAGEGDFDAAEELEEHWNRWGQTVPFTLLCGYLSAHFAASPDAAARLRRLCELHGIVQQDHSDMLANWLLSTAQST